MDEVALRLDNRFRLLTGGCRTALPRHQTLRATLDWSYELLAETDRLTLCHLAVFAGHFNLEAASAILADPDAAAPDVIERIACLVDKSLLSVRTSGAEVLSWELRTATSLARLRQRQGRTAEAVTILQPVYARFTEGFHSADLMAASTLLATLRGAAGTG